MPEALSGLPFAVEERLRSCQAGASFRVRDPASGELRMARRLPGDKVPGAQAAQRLVRQVRVAMGVAAPGLVAWRGAEEVPGGLVLLRDWVGGRSLLEHPRYRVGVDAAGRSDRAGAADLEAVAVSVLELLEALHRRGLLAHRLTPANLFCDDGGRLWLADWGVDCLGPGAGLGYTPPEDKGGASHDARGDLWALGAVLFEVATGRPPGGDCPSPDDLGRLGEPLAGVVGRLLQRDPSARFASAREALGALGRPLVAGQVARSAAGTGRLVGRSEELGELRAAVAALGRGQGELVFVRGDQGIGKTRLLGELERLGVIAGVRVLRGGEREPAGYPFGRLVPVFEQVAAEMARWSDDEVAPAIGPDGRVLLELTPAFLAVRRLAAMGEPPVLGAEAARRRLLRVAGRLLGGLAAHRPTLVLIDDFDSADALSVDLVRYLARTVVHGEGGTSPQPLLLVMAYRQAASGGLRSTVVSLRARQLARELALKPLAPHEVRDLLAAELGREQLPQGLAARVMIETGGVPFDVEDTLEQLAEGGVFDRPPEGWLDAWERLRSRSRAAAAPAAKDDVLALLLGAGEGGGGEPVRPRRAFAHLGSEVVRLLETVAIGGDGLPVEVARRASGLEAEALERALVTALARRLVVEPAPGRLMLRHDRLRDGIVAELDLPSRRLWHGRIGLALEQQIGELDERLPLELARHFQEAGDVERSLLYLPLAARSLKDRHHPTEALELLQHFHRHLEAVDPSERERHLAKRIQALHDMAQTLVQLDRPADASRAWREMASLAEGACREQDLVVAWSELASLSLDGGEPVQAESFAKRAAALARSQDLAVLVAGNLMVLGAVALQRSRMTEALWSLSGALKIYREQGDPLGTARALLAIGDVHFARLDYRQALTASRKAYRQLRELGDKIGVSWALNRLGRAYCALGDAARAVAFHREALRLGREADDRDTVGRTLDLMGDAWREQGDLARAEECLKEALALKRELVDVRGSADSLLRVAHVALLAGRTDDGLSQLEQALMLARRTGNRPAEVEALVRLAQGRERQGNLDAAAELARDAMGLAHGPGGRALHCRALLVLAAAAPDEERQGHGEQARDVARQAGFGDLLFRAEARLGQLAEQGGRPAAASEHYALALAAAAALLAGRRSARDGFFRRTEVRAALAAMAEFLRRQGGDDPFARHPVLGLAGDERAAQLVG